MKKIIILLCLLFTGYFSYSQVLAPAASPLSKVEQTVGLSEVTYEYSRPSMRGRTIFGDLVPYGKLWRTGANMRTKISFEHDVTIGGKNLPQGTYAIFSVPGPMEWEVIFYTDHSGSGAPAEMDETKVALRVKAPVTALATPVETFTMQIGNLSNSGGTLSFEWEKTRAAMDFAVPTEKLALASIEMTLAGPSPRDYYSAATYYYSEGKDIQQAKKWIDMALQGNEDPAFWQLRQKSLIYAKAGDKQGAIEAARKSLAKAEAAGNQDYVKMNKDSLKEWGAR